MSLLSIIDGDVEREVGLLSFGVISWCIQGVCSNASMKFFGFLIWFFGWKIFSLKVTYKQLISFKANLTIFMFNWWWEKYWFDCFVYAIKYYYFKIILIKINHVIKIIFD